MPEQVRQYVAIDAKSFYASVECVERQRNPLKMCIRDRERSVPTEGFCAFEVRWRWGRL